MKIITNDYGCGTSASILDYNLEDVVVVSEQKWDHIYDTEDDLFFIGHDFLYYMWDTDEKVKKLINHKYEKHVWCFERIDAVFDHWAEKSHKSIKQINKFTDKIYCCDEADHHKYKYTWLPQWASPLFYENRNAEIAHNKILFSGQAGKKEYVFRNDLISKLFHDEDLKEKLIITNLSRSFSWEDYLRNFLSFSCILNPVGTMQALNTRAYETIYSGRLLLQQTLGRYEKHEDLLSEYENIIFFYKFEDLKEKLLDLDLTKVYENDAYTKNNIFARFKSIGIEIK